MKRVFGFLAVFFLLSRLGAEDARVTLARQALLDGLPQVTIHQMETARGKLAADSDRAAADLLLGRALFATGRFADAQETLRKIENPDAETTFWLAESLAALGQADQALTTYQRVAENPEFAERAAIGRARMLRLLNRETEAVGELTLHHQSHPGSPAVALELAALLIDAGDAEGARRVLTELTDLMPEHRPVADFLIARTQVLTGNHAAAEAQLERLADLPANLAAGVVLARAECRVRQNDPAEAEKILETFVEENSRLPGLDGVFAALDRLYAAQSSPSSTELRKWAGDEKDATRAALARFYLARNEARLGNSDASRRVMAEFVEQNPGHFLANAARADLAESLLAGRQATRALEVVREGQGAKVRFLQGQAEAALGLYPAASGSFLEAAADSGLEVAALTNSALCAMLAGVPDEKNAALQKLSVTPDGATVRQKVLFYEALHQAAQRKPGAAGRLRELAEGDSPWADQARLALAEWNNLQLDLPAARAELRKISSPDPAEKERMDYLEVFLADSGEPDADAEVGRLAEGFLRAHPGSAFEPEVRMKLGEMLFRRGDFLGAYGQFDLVAEKFPDLPVAGKALFLSAQSLARSLSPGSMEQAIEIYNDVVEAGGPFALRARLAQAILLYSLKRPQDALGVLDNILASDPDGELRCQARIQKGEIFFALGEADPQNLARAVAAWQEVADDPEASKEWSHQALVKIGAAHSRMGDDAAALASYYAVFSKEQTGEPEYFWYYKAGFDAGGLLEKQKLWPEAIAVYEKISAVDGPRAGEARDRVNKLRLENFIWEN